MQRLPMWVSAMVLLALGWRAFVAGRRAWLPGRWLLIAAAIASTAGVLATFGPVLGRDASVALLAVMMALKCLELRTLRDANIVVCLGYFLIVTNFLYSQTIPTAVYMLVVLAWLTATTVSLQDFGAQMSPLQVLRTAATMLLQAAPLMLVLFVLFPRVQGPVFGIPQATSAGVTGLSDRMSPGDLSHLGLSDEVAFRVQFHTPAPKPAQLYWRGPVLWDFDGRTWTMGAPGPTSLPRHEATTLPVRYTVTLEPHHMRWLFAVDLPASLPPGAVLTDDYQLIARRTVDVRQRYELTSHLGYRMGVDQPPASLERALRLPSGTNPRSLELGQSIGKASASDAEAVNSALNFFRTQLFFYTLVPPELGRDPVDDFLFQTRRGFCEHYASAFVFLMRAAGVPARVVTGYQGGEINPLGDYLIVRQSEAHAWAEVWLAGQGWVRVDPTGAVSPARIETGIAAAIPRGEPLPGAARGELQLIKQLRFTLDVVANSWNQWVLGYTPDRQSKFLNRVGMATPNWQNLAAVLTAATGVVVLFLTAFILRRLWASPADPIVRAYRTFCRKLERAGLAREAAEGPSDFAQRVTRARPALAARVGAITQLYIELRYAGAGPERTRALETMVRAFRARDGSGR
jgi:transglutaminase-like putative cysteine protease